MRKLLITLLAGALGLSSGVLAACGNRNGLIPRTNAEALKHSLDKVAAAAGRHDCARATTALEEAQTRAFNVPASVNPKLRNNIDEGLSRLVQDVDAKCRTTTTSTQTTQTDTVPTVTNTTPTDTTTTNPPETTPTQTQTTPTVEPPSTPDQTGGTPPGQAKKLRRRGGVD